VSLPFKIFPWIWWKYYVLMYENRKIRPVETVPGMGEERNNGE
jgi:hypothetical protein